MKRFCPLVLLCAFAGVSVLAQEGGLLAPKKPSPQPATNLVVEIRNRKDRPAFIPGTGGVWFARFERIPGWQPPAGFVPVRAVDFSSRVVNETTLKVTVSLHRGVLQHEQQTPVAVFMATEGETIVVEGLKEFGLAPIEFKVGRVRPREEHAPPYIESPTSALELVGVERLDKPFPAYVARLRNVSGKDIAALHVNNFNERGEKGSRKPQHPQNEPLIKAGEVYELHLSAGSSGEMTPVGYAPDRVQKVTIPTVFFADETFAGELLPAIEIIGFRHGRKVQLTRALALMQDALQSPEAKDSAAAIAQFKLRVSALGAEVEPQIVEQLKAKLPALKTSEEITARWCVGFTLRQVKIDLLKSVKQFEDAPAAGSPTFRQWLASMKANYEQWIARL